MIGFGRSRGIHGVVGGIPITTASSGCVERASLEDRAAEQRLRVRDRRRAAVDGSGRQLPRETIEQALAHARRCELEEPPDARAEQPVDRFLVVRIAGERAGDPRQVQRERHAGHRDPLLEPPLELERELPALRAARLEQRQRAGGSKSFRAGCAEQRARPAVDDRLRRGDRQHEVGLDEGTVDAQRNAVDARRPRRGPRPPRRARRSGRGSVAGTRAGRAGRSRAATSGGGARRRRRSSAASTPSRSSSSAAAAIARCRGPSVAAGIGSDGCSITSVAVPPRVTSRSSGSPASGNASASRTACGTSSSTSRCGGGRRTTSSTPGSATTMRVSASSGTRVMWLRCAAAAVTPSATKMPAREIPARPRAAAAAAEAAREQIGEERVQAVGRERDRREREPEHRDLRRNGRAAVDELRQEGEEEQRRLRVEDVDDHALAVDAAHRRRRRLHLLRVVAAERCGGGRRRSDSRRRRASRR